MSHPVITAFVPVLMFIALGVLAGSRGWVKAPAVGDLSNLVFFVLTPALLFRTMSTVHVESLDFRPATIYLGAAALIFAGTLAWLGLNRRAAVLGLAGTFSNTVMIGIPLVGLAFGEAGLVTLFTLISVHSLVLLTAATMLLEIAVAKESPPAQRPGWRPVALTLARAMKNGLLHPVPLPILLGLLFAQTGWQLPPLIDQPLRLLGLALGPMALLLVGITLAHGRLGTQLKGAAGLSLVKNLLHPLLVAAIGLALGARGLALAVMVVVASLPTGANVFLFSQRYRVAEAEVTASVGLSTLLALVTVPLAMALAQWL